MAALCPACEHEPTSAAAGEPCPRCGTNLIAIAAPIRDEMIGATIDGRFVIEAQLGAGAMGTVYVARQTSIGRQVALKLMDRALDQDAAAAKRFFREAQLASRLAHPNTVHVIEFGQADGGRLYLAMELVRGETLAAVARREGTLALARVAKIGIQLCDAMEAAHALGIVHRDLKLDNVMVLEGGRDLIKVLDFGLARSVSDDAHRATATGVFAGTPRYLAPEVVLRAAAPAPAQDLYALGVILAELAGGRELWGMSTLQELFARKAVAALDLAHVPRALAPVIARLLEADPELRPSVGDVRAQLASIASGQTIEAAAPGRALAGDGGVLAALADLGSTMPEIHEPREVGEVGEVGDYGDAAGRPFGGASVTLPQGPGGAAVARVAHAATAPAWAVAPSHVIGPAGTMVITPSAIVPIDQANQTRVTRPPGQPPPLPPTVAVRRIPTAPVLPDEHPPIAPLEIEREWQDFRAAKQAAPVPDPARPAPRRSGLSPGLVVAVGLLGAGIAAGLVYQRHRHRGAPPPGDPARPTVSLHVTSPSPVDVRIDGTPVGRTPLTFDRLRGSRALTITAQIDGHEVARQVTPDRDQDIDLAP